MLRRWVLTRGAAATVLAWMTLGPPASAQVGDVSAIPLPSRAQREYLASVRRASANRRPGAGSELMILLAPTLTGPEIEAALKEHELVLVDAAPQIGALTVDASARLDGGTAPHEPSLAASRRRKALKRLIRRLAHDKRFVAVTENRF